jgi:hypothetical protein
MWDVAPVAIKCLPMTVREQGSLKKALPVLLEAKSSLYDLGISQDYRLSSLAGQINRALSSILKDHRFS